MDSTVPPKLDARNVCLTHVNERTQRQLEVLSGIDLAVREGELLTIVGPSGCGKTTFLNAVDGLIGLSGGHILVDVRTVSGRGPDRDFV